MSGLSLNPRSQARSIPVPIPIPSFRVLLLSVFFFFFFPSPSFAAVDTSPNSNTYIMNRNNPNNHNIHNSIHNNIINNIINNNNNNNNNNNIHHQYMNSPSSSTTTSSSTSSTDPLSMQSSCLPKPIERVNWALVTPSLLYLLCMAVCVQQMSVLLYFIYHHYRRHRHHRHHYRRHRHHSSQHNDHSRSVQTVPMTPSPASSPIPPVHDSPDLPMVGELHLEEESDDGNTYDDDDNDDDDDDNDDGDGGDVHHDNKDRTPTSKRGVINTSTKNKKSTDPQKHDPDPYHSLVDDYDMDESVPIDTHSRDWSLLRKLKLLFHSITLPWLLVRFITDVLYYGTNVPYVAIQVLIFLSRTAYISLFIWAVIYWTSLFQLYHCKSLRSVLRSSRWFFIFGGVFLALLALFEILVSGLVLGYPSQQCDIERLHYSGNLFALAIMVFWFLTWMIVQRRKRWNITIQAAYAPQLRSLSSFAFTVSIIVVIMVIIKAMVGFCITITEELLDSQFVAWFNSLWLTFSDCIPVLLLAATAWHSSHIERLFMQSSVDPPPLSQSFLN